VKKDEDSRPVKARYYNGTGNGAKAIKTTAGKYPHTMMRNAYHHLQLQHFGRKIVHCEVFDANVLHGTQTMQYDRVKGKWHVDSWWHRHPRHGLGEEE
jgi:hypothetical protein